MLPNMDLRYLCCITAIPVLLKMVSRELSPEIASADLRSSAGELPEFSPTLELSNDLVTSSTDEDVGSAPSSFISA